MDTSDIAVVIPDMGLNPFEAELFVNIAQSLSVLRGSASQDIVLGIMSGLRPFPQDIALKVSKEAIWNLNRYAGPLEFVELARQFHGVSKADLLAQGRAVFYELFHLKDPQCDLICSNWRVVYAVKREFVSLRNFFSTAEGEQPCWKQKRFAESFAYVDFIYEAKVAKEYFLEGFEIYPRLTPEGRRYINFLGDFKQCKRILKRLQLGDIYQLPALSRDDAIVTLPAPTEEQKPVAKPTIDPQQLQSFSEMVDALSKKLAEQRSDSGSM